MRALAIDYFDKKTKHKFRLPLTAFKKPSNGEEYAFLEELLDRLIDEVRDDEDHPGSPFQTISGKNQFF